MEQPDHNKGSDNGPANVQEMALDLNFVPDWARHPPERNPYPSEFPAAAEEKRGKRRPRRETRRDHRRPPKRPRPSPAPRPDRSEEALLPMDISFLPEQKHLSRLISDIRASQRAYPLPQLAALFLRHPENHMIKFMGRKDKDGNASVILWQDRLSGRLFLDQDKCLAQVAKHLLETKCTKETVKVDPPSGRFVCVARCRLSGTLLGPPNHHEYNERVDALRRTRFPHMPLDQYRRNIETVHDPEWIERWKEEWSTRTLYRLQNGKDEADPMSEMEALEYLRSGMALKYMVKGNRFVLPGGVTRRIEDERLRHLLQVAWNRESRMPATLMRALHGAFRRLGLNVFRTKDGKTFVTAIFPRPIDPQKAVKAIGAILEYLREHPGCTRRELIKGVNPWAENDPKKMAEIMKNVVWLIERGHVVEFHNGTLAIPGGSGKKVGSKKVGSKK